MSFENVCRRRINRLHGPKGIMGRRDIHHPVIIHQPWVDSQARWWIYIFSQKACEFCERFTIARVLPRSTIGHVPEAPGTIQFEKQCR